MNSVAIIGAGITGLTAAFRLQQKHIPVTVYEAADRPGGVIRSVQRNGFLAECGPNTILETSPLIHGLIEDLGLGTRRLYSNPAASNRYIVRNGKPLAAPGSVAEFATTRLFSAAAKLRLLREPFIRPAPACLEEDLGEFVLRRLGREFLDYAIDPFVAGIYSGDPAHLSVREAFPKLYALEQRYGSLIRGQLLGTRERKRRAEVSKQSAKKFSFDGGLQVLIDRLHSVLGTSVSLDSPVKCLRQTSSGWSVEVQSPWSGQVGEHSALLYAGTASNLVRMKILADDIPTLEPLSGVYHPPVASVVLGFRREEVRHALNGFGMLIPRVEKCNILGTIFSSSLFPGRAPDGHVTLTSYLGGARNPDLPLKDRAELTRLTLLDLRKLLGVVGQPVFEHHSVFPKAIPQYDVGFGKLRALMTEVERRAPGLFLAGHYRDGISLGDSVLSGHAAAERIEQHLLDRAKCGTDSLRQSLQSV